MITALCGMGNLDLPFFDTVSLRAAANRILFEVEVVSTENK